MEKKNLKLFKYIYKYNIEQVYKCYNCYNITAYLKNQGLLQNLNIEPEVQHLSLEQEINLDNSYIIRKYIFGNFKILIKTTVNTPTYKKIKLIFKEMLGISKLKEKFDLVIELYHTANSNSTMLLFHIECTKPLENWITYYFKKITNTWRMKMCQDYERYLQKWIIPNIFMDSVLISLNVNEVFRNILDGSIFLKHPLFKGYTLVLEKKNSLIGSTYLFIKKEEKILYVLSSIKKDLTYISLTFMKKTGNSSFDKDVQFIFTKLENKLTLLQYYSKLYFSFSNKYSNSFKQTHKKILFGIKKIFEK